MTATEHRIRVERYDYIEGPPVKVSDLWVWTCACKATGNAHDTHQVALEFGMAHLRIESE